MSFLIKMFRLNLFFSFTLVLILYLFYFQLVTLVLQLKLNKNEKSCLEKAIFYILFYFSFI